MPISQDRQVTLAGKAVTLRFSLKAMMALKDKWAVDDDAEVQRRLDNAKTSDFITLFWACTRTHHPEMTEADVLGLLDDAGLEGVAQAMQDTLGAAMPQGADPGPQP